MQIKRVFVQVWMLGAVLLAPALATAQLSFITNNGSITITGYSGGIYSGNGDVVIPASTNGYPVTSIDVSAFESKIIGSVTVPNSVTNIGSFAFRYSNALTNVVLPESLLSIGDAAFYQCGIYSITLPDSITTVPEDMFCYCGNLNNVVLGAHTTMIGAGSFFYCNALTKMTVPDSLVVIGSGAFSACSALTNFVFGPHVTTIASGAFSGTSLTNIWIPTNVTNMGDYPFLRCPGPFNVDPQSLYFSSRDGVLFNRDQSQLIQCGVARSGNYTIPSTVTTIWDLAFGYCMELNNVTLPDSLNQLSFETFGYCYGLTNVTFPAGFSDLNRYTFVNCYSLSGLYFHGNAPSFEDEVFLNDTNVTVYYLPGTTGWGSTFDGWPTALWMLPYPTILTSGTGVGIHAGQFGFDISWAANPAVAIDTCTNLSNPVWMPLQTDDLADGVAHFSDPTWTNYTPRFYRVRSP